jgi:predicted PurR-regulated permease PerM
MLESQFPRRQTISTVILTCGIVLGLVLCYLLAIPFIPAIVGSLTLAVLFAPLDTKIRTAVRSAGMSAAVTVAVVALIVVVPAVVLIGTLLGEAGRSAALIGSLVDSEAWMRAIESRPRLVPVFRLINERFDIPDLVKASTSWLAGWSGTFVQGSFSGMLSLMLTFYFLFYLLRDREAIRAAVEGALPLSGTEFSKLADRVVDTIFATVLGMAAVAALQGVLGGVMFWWLGLPAPLFWGTLMGLLAVVPFLGAFVIWAPTALFLALAGDVTSAAILAVWGTIVVGLVDNVVYPVLVGKKLMLHTVPSFIAVAGGLILLGAPGIVLGPIIVSVSLTLLGILRSRISESARTQHANTAEM